MYKKLHSTEGVSQRIKIEDVLLAPSHIATLAKTTSVADSPRRRLLWSLSSYPIVWDLHRFAISYSWQEYEMAYSYSLGSMSMPSVPPDVLVSTCPMSWRLGLDGEFEISFLFCDLLYYTIFILTRELAPFGDCSPGPTRLLVRQRDLPTSATLWREGWMSKETLQASYMYV